MVKTQALYRRLSLGPTVSVSEVLGRSNGIFRPHADKDKVVASITNTKKKTRGLGMGGD
jgi:hypothetical protein